MGGVINVTNSDKPKHVLMVIANPATSTTLGIPVGFWGAEATHAYHAFTEVGYAVELHHATLHCDFMMRVNWRLSCGS